MQETLEASLEEVLRITAMDAGGIYLVDEESACLDLVTSRGLTPAFLEPASHHAADSQHAQVVMRGDSLFFGPEDLERMLTEAQRGEGLRSLAAIPVLNEGQGIACLNIASHVNDAIAPNMRLLLEAMTAQLGSAIARAQAQERLLQSEERYRNFVTNASEGIYRIDFTQPVPIDLPDDELEAQIGRNAVLGEVNDALARMYGLRPVEMQGRPATDFAPEYGARGALVVRAPNHQIIETETIDLDPQGQEVHLAESFTGIVEQGQLIRIWGMQRNITARRLAEEERQRLQEQLQQSQKMEAIGRLAGGVAHDFNNLLTGIIGYAELLLEAVEPGDPLRPDLEEILKAGERAAELTSQLLAFSRKQVIAPRVIERQRGAGALAEDAATDHRRGHRPAPSGPRRGLGRIKADPAQLEQVLVNLAVNARDAMPDGGKLTIETRQRRPGRGPTASGATSCRPGELRHARGQRHRLRHGRGDPGTDLRALLHHQGQATRAPGLGLATVYGIVKQNGGCINVYSEPEIGTTFKIYLPRVYEQVERPTERRAARTPAGARDDPAGGGRGDGAPAGPADPRAAGLHGARGRRRRARPTWPAASTRARSTCCSPTW